MQIRSTTIFILLLFIFIEAFGQEQFQSLEKSLDNLLSENFKPGEPGIAVLIAKNKKIIYEHTYGSADMELDVPLQSDMVFKIGSITKQFTAVGILKLAEQGKISLQDSLQKYVKEFPSKGHTITIEHLLTHTSGIREFTAIEHPTPYIERSEFSPQMLIDHFKGQPLEFQPGAKYAYSNSGYVLLAFIIEKVSGQSFHQYIQEHLLVPAGLHHTYFANEKLILPKRVKGYTRDNGFYQNCEYQSISMAYGCGDLLSTVSDLCNWNNALLDGKIINKQSLNMAFKPYQLKNGTRSNYGYGWFVDQMLGKNCIHHEGQVSGFIGLEKYFPDDDLYVAILTNVKSGEDKTDFSDNRFRLFRQIVAIALSEPLKKQVQLSQETLESYIGTYKVDRIFKNDSLTSAVKEKAIITIRLGDGKLYADLSNGTGKNMLLVPISQSKFLLPDVERIRTTIEFSTTADLHKVLYWIQEKKSMWKKVE
ncbi:serine hydrolase domain-containing protein [Pedobacter frigoris]|uniref:serine hydrolase domain-containing protein n=1 Tax=Pedobacter frigoris TaxID=2571272 RepID=UPI00292DFDC3|nr:serine hydrolase domain-containing protein [Pedobacter frigoris]